MQNSCLKGVVDILCHTERITTAIQAKFDSNISNKIHTLVFRRADTPNTTCRSELKF